MKTLAPELSALMTIFGSAGPVSSTRRSFEVGGRGRDRPLGLAQLPRLLRERRPLAGGEARLALVARLEQRRRRGPKRRWRSPISASASRVEQLVLAGNALGDHLGAHAARPRLMLSASPRSASAPPLRSGEPCVVRMRSAGSSARRRSAPGQPGPAVPRALCGGAAVPAGRAHPQALALRRLRSRRRRSRRHRARACGSGAGHRPSLRWGRRGESRARRRGRRRRAHRSVRRRHRLRAGASAPS